MSVLGFTGRTLYKPAWTYHARGIVWRLFPSPYGVLVGEDRVNEEKRVTFFCINQLSGEVLWEKIEFHEKWWIGIEKVHGDRIFLHGFSTPDMPEHKGITAIDLFTGRTAWSNPDIHFILSVEDSVFVFRDAHDGRLLYELNYRTGDSLQTWHNDSAPLVAARSRVVARTGADPEFPLPLETYPGADERGLTLAQKHCAEENIVGPIEAIEKDGLLLFNYHKVRKSSNGIGEQLTNILEVLDIRDGGMVLTEVLNRSVPGVVPDSFFVLGDMLYFVKERSALTAVNLSELKR